MRFVIAAVLAFGLYGCSARPELPPRAKVTGVVKINGRPLPVGRINFTPDRDKGNDGPVAVGAIDAQGRFELQTDRDGDGSDGAAIGFHKVCIIANRSDSSDPLKVYSLIPGKYNKPETSGLTAEVKAIEVNEITFELKTQ